MMIETYGTAYCIEHCTHYPGSSRPQPTRHRYTWTEDTVTRTCLICLCEREHPRLFQRIEERERAIFLPNSAALWADKFVIIRLQGRVPYEFQRLCTPLEIGALIGYDGEHRRLNETIITLLNRGEMERLSRGKYRVTAKEENFVRTA